MKLKSVSFELGKQRLCLCLKCLWQRLFQIPSVHHHKCCPKSISKKSQAFKLVTLTKCWFNIWENICDLGTNIYSLGSKRYLHFAAMPAIMYFCCTSMHSWIKNRNTAALHRQIYLPEICSLLKSLH